MHVLAYHSRSLIAPDDLEAQLHSIIASCTRNNRLHNITGVLIHEGGQFVQLLEGEKPDLEKIMSKISADARHKDISRFVDEPIEQRSFPDWAMETFFLSNADILQASTLHSLRAIYSNNYRMESRRFILFLHEMLDQIDVFKINNPE